MSRSSIPSSMVRPLLTAMALLLVVAAPVSATDGPARLGLTPVGQDGSYFRLKLKPGQVRRLKVEAANFGDAKTLARTYAADVYTIVNGGFGARLFGERPTGTTLWMTYPTKEIALGPEEAVAIDFQVRVPADTPPGEYVTALVIENAEPFRGSGNISVDQVNRSAIAVAIEVPGKSAPSVEIGDVRHEVITGLSVISFKIQNTGNVHLRPAGQFVLRSAAGQELARSSVAMDTVYAGTSTVLEAPAVPLLDPGEYCAELTLTDEETGASDTAGCQLFTIAAPAADEGSLADVPKRVADAIGSGPILPVLLLVLVLGGGAAVFMLGRRRRRSAFASGPSDRPNEDGGGAGPTFVSPLVGVIGALRRVLDEQPEIIRAWIIERGSGLVLAFEGNPGLSPADATRIASMLQERADREIGLTMPMQVVCLQESGPVARMTADAVPFYVKLRDA